MANLLEVLRTHDITPVVVTASQIELVRAVVGRYYGVEAEAVQGMDCRQIDGRYDGWLTPPVTFGPGKVDAFRHVAERLGAPDARPVFCAGDSNTDFELVAFSTDGRCFFDRGKRPFMGLAERLLSGEERERTIRQPLFG